MVSSCQRHINATLGWTIQWRCGLYQLCALNRRRRPPDTSCTKVSAKFFLTPAGCQLLPPLPQERPYHSWFALGLLDKRIQISGPFYSKDSITYGIRSCRIKPEKITIKFFLVSRQPTGTTTSWFCCGFLRQKLFLNQVIPDILPSERADPTNSNGNVSHGLPMCNRQRDSVVMPSTGASVERKRVQDFGTLSRPCGHIRTDKGISPRQHN